MPEIVVAFTTVPAGFDAATLARDLVAARVAACVTIVSSIRSVYRWEGRIHDEGEQQLIIKTTRESADALWTTLKARHPHDVPEFIVLPVVHGNPAYLDWVRGEVG
jgi:periplasmic divalent cation tolerance protein